MEMRGFAKTGCKTLLFSLNVSLVVQIFIQHLVDYLIVIRTRAGIVVARLSLCSGPNATSSTI